MNLPKQGTWILLAFGACGAPVDLGTPAAIDGGKGPPATSDSGAPPSHDSGAVVFHLIEPLAVDVQRAAGDPGRLRTVTSIFALSSDASVVIASSGVGDMTGGTIGAQAVRWTEAGGTVGLGFLPQCERTDGFPPNSNVSAASSDGSVVLGYCSVGRLSWLFRWTQVDRRRHPCGVRGGSFY